MLCHLAQPERSTRPSPGERFEGGVGCGRREMAVFGGRVVRLGDRA